MHAIHFILSSIYFLFFPGPSILVQTGIDTNFMRVPLDNSWLLEAMKADTE
jgi:hypothetical protein